jgi:hypothetical protein
MRSELVGAVKRVALRELLVLVDKSTEAIAPEHVEMIGGVWD